MRYFSLHIREHPTSSTFLIETNATSWKPGVMVKVWFHIRNHRAGIILTTHCYLNCHKNIVDQCYHCKRRLYLAGPFLFSQDLWSPVQEPLVRHTDICKTFLTFQTIQLFEMRLWQIFCRIEHLSATSGWEKWLKNVSIYSDVCNVSLRLHCSWQLMFEITIRMK